jgi:calcineurin-like phosphoesterase family protein
MFFTSDPHFWHKRVIESCNRPFGSIEEMNAALIKNWNDTVGPTDEIYILGDVFFCGTTKAKEILAQLNGKKHWILGNHDWMKPRRAAEFGFEWVNDYHTFESEFGTVFLCHYPYRNAGDHTEEERYSDRRLIDFGNWLLHGHVHCAWKIKGKQINVGVDQWNYKPVHFDELAVLMKQA